MNILITVNSAFARQSVVLIKSILCHNPDVRIYVLYCDLKENEILLLKDFCMAEGTEITFLKAEKDILSGLRTAEPFSCEVYLRLFAHLYLPEDVEKILYLDTDIICNGSLKDFYDTDLKEYSLLACARDDAFCNADFLRENWDKKDALRGKYFNSGVLLLNCKKMRAIFPDTECLQKFIQSAGIDYLFDQGLLNYIYAKNSILITSSVYNFRLGYYLKNCPDVLGNIRMDDVKLIHYSGEITPYKPWDLCFTDDEIEKYELTAGNAEYQVLFSVRREINENAKIWWEYAANTPVYEELLSEMTVKKEWFKRGISGFLKRLSVL